MRRSCWQLLQTLDRTDVFQLLLIRESTTVTALVQDRGSSAGEGWRRQLTIPSGNTASPAYMSLPSLSPVIELPGHRHAAARVP